MHFPVSGVDCPLWLPPLAAFALAALTAPAGLSGAFLLLPFQMSVLGFVAPAVTPTNLLYNVVAIPGGVFEYIRERRMAWPLTWTVAAGTLPGVFAGAFIRIRYLPDPRLCKLFVGFVLLYLGFRLLLSRSAGSVAGGGVVRTTSVALRRIEFEFSGSAFGFRPASAFSLALLVGVVGGIYGVGGGAIIAPYLVAILRLPVHATAGASLFGTLLTSAAGVAFFEILGRTSLSTGLAVRPDWALGALFGAGGLLGTYCGARLQRYLPERLIRTGLGLLVTALAAAYIVPSYWRGGA
jgi:uncharacterized membrane protein YfcA